jgi:dimethylargininase
MRIAITRQVSESIARCELTYLPREAIDVERARAQHDEYEGILAELGCEIHRVEDAPDLPDAVFVEDIAVVLDEVAIITLPGALSRRAEVPGMARALRPFRELALIDPPGMLEGGDVLLIGKHIYAGLSGRTNADGITQLRKIASHHGFQVSAVPIRGCLHLKSAVTAVGEGAILINPEWVDPGYFNVGRMILVHASEPHAGNALLLDEEVVYPTGFPFTQKLLSEAGIPLRILEITELQKAEGAVTCCSVIFDVATP